MSPLPAARSQWLVGQSSQPGLHCHAHRNSLHQRSNRSTRPPLGAEASRAAMANVKNLWNPSSPAVKCWFLAFVIGGVGLQIRTPLVLPLCYTVKKPKERCCHNSPSTFN